MRSPCTLGGVRRALVVGALLVTATAVAAAPSRPATRHVPRPVVGCWKRHVPPGVPGVPIGTYTISATNTGLLIVYLEGRPGCGARPDFSATVASVGAKVAIGPIPALGPECAGRGVYSWSRSGSRLTLRRVADACRLRRNFFATVWTRVSA
jgi:hypothetical protein